MTPTDDAYIRPDNPATNFGAATTLQVDNSAVKNFLVRFNVSGTAGRQILSARLRMYCVDPSPQGGQFLPLLNMATPWGESTVNWNNAPAAGATPVASLGAVASGTWYEVDIKPVVTGDGVVSLRVTSPSNDGADYYSKEGPAGFAPQLVIVLQ